MSLIPYSPYRSVFRDQDFSRLLHNFFPRMEEDETAAGYDWAPAVDIKEEDHHYTIHADVPGINPEDIDVSLELRRLGLSMPNQAWFLNLLNEEMAEQGMNPTDPRVFGIWSITAIKAAQFYAAALADEDRQTPDEPKLKRVMGHYIGLCLEGAVDSVNR